MARASRSSCSLPYNWPQKSDLLLRNSLLELVNFLIKIRENDVSYHGGPRHHHTGLATDPIFSRECHQRFGRLDHLERLQMGVHHPFETVRSYLRHLGFCAFFQVFFQQASSCLRILFVTLASALYLFASASQAFSFSLVVLSIRPFVLNNIGVFLNTGQKNLLFIRRINSFLP